MPGEQKPTTPDVQFRDVGDFFGPTFQVAFLRPDADAGVIQAQLGDSENFGEVAGSGQTQGSPTASPFIMDSAFLSRMAASLTVECTMGAPFRFTLTLTPPYADAIRIIDNRLIQAFSLVKVRFGYASTTGGRTLSKIHIFRLNSPALSVGNDVTITLTGVDVFSSVLSRNTTKKIWNRLLFPSDISIINLLSGKVGLSVDASLLPTNASIRASKTTPAEQHVTDMEYIKSLCQDNNVEFHAEGTSLRLYEHDTAMTQVPNYRFIYVLGASDEDTTILDRDYQINYKRDIPIMSFSANTDIRAFLPKEALGIRAVSWDPDSGESIAELIDARASALVAHIGALTAASSLRAGGQGGSADALIKSLGSGGPLAGKTITDAETNTAAILQLQQELDDIGTVIYRPGRKSGGSEFIMARSREAEMWANQRATITAPGWPDVFPPVIVNVDGVGQSFRGSYIARSVKHTLSTDGYEMTVGLVRNTSSSFAGGEVPVNPVTEASSGAAKTSFTDRDGNPN